MSQSLSQESGEILSGVSLVFISEPVLVIETPLFMSTRV